MNFCKHCINSQPMRGHLRKGAWFDRPFKTWVKCSFGGVKSKWGTCPRFVARPDGLDVGLPELRDVVLWVGVRYV